MLGQVKRETDTKEVNEFRFLGHEPLRNAKKTLQAFESLNSDVRVSS